MAAVISGNGLGLFGGSSTTVGGSPAQIGQGKDSQFVNVATGNLLLQSQDEHLAFRGLPIAQLRTYNSLGTVAQMGADGWLTGFERRVELISGTFNQAGSVMRRWTGDGAYQDFVYASANTYVSTAGDGAHDTLTFSGSLWTYTEGSTRYQEDYDSAQQGRLQTIRSFKSDATTPTAWSVSYDAQGRISAITANDGTATGDALLFGYDATTGFLSAVATRENGLVKSQVWYEYDTANRLSAVITDLTPDVQASVTAPRTGDNLWNATAANNNGKLFRTTYAYDGSSLRIASVTQSDGTVTSYTYDSANGYKVKTVTRGDTNTNDADGVGETVTYTYGTNTTTVTDSLGRAWAYGFDAQGRLLTVTAPPVGGLSDVTAYEYDADGNLKKVTTTRGGTPLAQTDYQYDANGNVLEQWDLLGNTISRTYSASNQLLSETRYTGVDLNHTDAVPATGAMTTRYVYDGRDRLRFAVDADGGVTEYLYASDGNGIGQASAQRRYTAWYGGAYDETSLATWSAGQRTGSTLTEYAYDLWGRLQQSTAYATLDANGVGVLDAGTALSRFTYDAQGLLRTQITVRGAGRTLNGATPSGSEVLDYTYDGMGRLLGVVKRASETASGVDASTVATTYAYLDSGHQLAVTQDSGAIRTETRNAAGRLVSVVDSGTVSGATVTRTTQNYYDSTGQLRATQDANGGLSYFFYDAKGRLVGTVDNTGALVETTYTGLDQVETTKRYSTRVNTVGWLSVGQVTKTDIATVRPGWSTDFSSLPIAGLYTDQVNNPAYANALVLTGDGRLAFDVNDSAAANWPYIYRPVEHSLAEGVMYSGEVTTGADMSNTYLLFSVQKGARKGSAYFRNGTLYKYTEINAVSDTVPIGTLATNTTYVVQARTRDGSIDYTVYVKGQDPSTGWMFSIAAEAKEWGDVKFVANAYCAPGQNGNALYLDNLTESDPGIVTSSRTYDTAGRLIKEINETGSITNYSYDGANRLLQVRETDANNSAATARATRNFYDNADRLVGVLDAEGYLSEIAYDAAGRAISTTRYANVSSPTYWATGTLAQLRPTSDATNDQVTRVYYDARGNKVGELDAQGYFTEWTIDNAGNTRAERRYLAQLTWQSSDTWTSLRGRAGSLYRESRMAYNALGQLLTQTNPEGTVTRFSYDEAGRLVRTETAVDTSEVRENFARYNVFGELIGELSGEGAEKAKTLLGGKLPNDPTLTDTQLNQAYAAYGVRHSVDSLGRRIESIDAQGNKTWTFYDNVGRPTFVVRGVADGNNVANALGEVTETRYNAFGEILDSIAYTGRITLGTPGDRASAATAVGTLAYVSASDTRRKFTYNARGQLASVTNATGTVTQYGYNDFGQRRYEVLAAGTSVSRTIDYVYDRRGLLTTRIDELGRSLQRSTSQAYDAFGRVKSATDARGSATTFTYDRLGRQLTQSRTVQNRVEISTTSYDAFDRVISVLDPANAALGAQDRPTTYVYSTANRTVTVTTPEGVAVTTTHNRHGQTASVKQTLPDGITTAETIYTYDRDGNLVSTKDPLNNTSTNEYDVRGLLAATVDASGRRVELRYDAVGRVLQRIEDPGANKLNLTTTYTYDAQGRKLTVTDPSNRVTSFAYDLEGRLKQMTQDPASLNLRTTYDYDAQGRQVTVTEGFGTANPRVTQYNYDVLGRRTSEVLDPGPTKLNLTTTYVYDANDNVIRRIDANNNTTRYYYDEANRLIHTVDPLGAITRSWYDADGRAVATRRFDQFTDVSTLTDATSLAQMDARLDWNAKYEDDYRIYDRDGRLRFTLDGELGLQEMSYDTANRLVATRSYVTRFIPSGALLNKMFAGTALPADFTPVVNDAEDLVTYQVYDAAGRVRYTVDGAGDVAALTYDKAGRVVSQTRYAQAAPLNSTLRNKLRDGTAVLNDISSITPADPARDMVSYRVYDAAGRQQYSVDGMGAAQRFYYDAAGRNVATVAYATVIALSSTLRNELATADVAAGNDLQTEIDKIDDSARDRVDYRVYDAAGRLRQSIDGLGSVVEWGYDSMGQVASQTAYATAVGASALATLEPNLLKGLASATPTVNGAADHAVKYVRDVAGRVRYTLTQDSATTFVVSERRYDAMGRVIADVAYAPTIAAGTYATPSAVSTAQGAAATLAGNQRLTQYVYDRNGGLRFTIDDAFAVTEQRFDGLGRVKETRQYGKAIPTSTVINEAAVASAVASASDVRVTSNAYDYAGRVISVTDAAGKVEYYGYNVLGQRTSLTNKLNQTWTYSYDAAGRMTQETSPNVLVTSIDKNGAVTTNTRAIVTQINYDALGNVVSRVEDAGMASRTTSYQYDAAGRQTRTTFPDAFKIDEATGDLTTANGTPTIDVIYDAFGQAVVQKDVRGNYTYKVYDRLGRVAYDIDAEGYATRYAYDGFDQQTALTRYATRMNMSGLQAGAIITEAQAASRMVSGADRTITTAYDQRGNKISVVQSPLDYYKADGSKATDSPTVQMVYDSFGQLIKESVLIEGAGAGAVWAHTYRYYDELGRQTLAVDPEGYVTRTTYDALGQVTEAVEFARAIATSGLSTASAPGVPAAGDAATGFDRITRFAYDALGRKTSETGVVHYQLADGTAAVRDVTTIQTYDAEGHVVRTSVDGIDTANTYDALGRLVSVQEAERDVLRADAEARLASSSINDLTTASLYERASPYTTLAYDAFGNQVRVVRYANGVRNGVATADGSRDQIVATRYDRQGRAVMVIDAEGNKTYNRYDAADHLIETWRRLDGSDGRWANVRTRANYDKVGQQTDTTVTRETWRTYYGTTTAVGQVAGAWPTEQQEHVSYNAFGEIVTKGFDGSTQPLQYFYDAAGRLVASNAEGGVMRNYGYNLAGAQVRETHKTRTSAGVIDATTTQVVDKLGRVTSIKQPAYGETSDQPVIRQRFDRWGNVIEVVNARGFQTTMEYNAANQVTRTVEPLVQVVNANGTTVWQRPESRTYYDALGRVIADKDANGNIHRTVYDAVGRAVVSTDALGATVRTGFDALGNERLQQDPVGHLTYQRFDRLGRVTEHGDFLPTPDGQRRDQLAIERYVLNQNGDRLKVTDAANAQSVYDYDSRHLLLRSQTAMGIITSYEYDSQGNKTKEINALSDSSYMSYLVPVYNGGLVYNFARQVGSTFSYTIPAGAFTIPNGAEPEYSIEIRRYKDYPDYKFLPVTDSGLSFDPATRTISGTVSMLGTYSFTITARSSSGKSVTQTLGLSVLSAAEYGNSASYPQLVNGIPDQSVVAGSVWSYDVSAATFSDAQPLTYKAQLGVWVPATIEYDRESGRYFEVEEAHWQYSDLTANDWVSFNPSLRRFSGTPNTIGNWQLLVVATDPDGHSASTSFGVATKATANSPTGIYDASENETVYANQQSWDYDAFGRLLDHNDLSGIDYDYTYDGVTGQQVAQSSDWTQTNVVRTFSSLDLLVNPFIPLVNEIMPGTISSASRLFTYYANGQLAELREGTNIYRYQYDAAGNRILEESETQDPNGALIKLRTRMTYDSHNRLEHVIQEDYTTTLKRILDIVYSYDANGNRRRIQAQGALSSTAPAINTANRAPTNIAPVANRTIRSGIASSFGIRLADIFNDADRNPLTISVKQVVNGVDQDLPGWLSTAIDPATGQLVISATTGSSAALGQDLTIKLIASDGSASANVSFVLSVRTNSGPTALAGTPTFNARLNTAFTTEFAACNYFQDIDVGDSLTLDVTSTLPSWLTLDASNPAALRFTGTPTTAGTYAVTVRATDRQGATVTKTFNIVAAANFAPVAVAQSGTSFVIGRVNSWDRALSSVFTDADSNLVGVTATLADGSPLPAWLTLETVNLADGPHLLLAGQPPLGTTDNTSYSVKLIATDAFGLTATTTLALTARENRAPSVVGSVATQTPRVNQLTPYSKTVSIASLFSDSDNDAMDFSLSIPANDPTSQWLKLTVDRVTGTLKLSGTPNNNAQAGTHVVQIVARDPDGASATINITYQIAADNPPAYNTGLDDRVIIGGHGLNLAIPANAFTDIDGDSLTYTAVQLKTFTETLDTVPPTEFSYDEEVALPNWLIFDGQTFTGTVPSSSQPIRVIVRASDPLNRTAEKMFTLTIAAAASNTAPVYTAGSLVNRNGNEGQAVDFVMPAGAFTDVNADALSYSAQVLVGASWVAASTIGLSVNASTGRITGTLANCTQTSYSVKVIASDGTASASGTFTLSVNRKPIVATAIPTQNVARNTNWSYQLPANTFTDPEGATLVNYTATGLPSGITFDATTRTFSGKATSNSSNTVTVTVSDGVTTGSTTFALNIINLDPVYATTLPARSGIEGVALNFALPANTFTDPNGDTLTYTGQVQVGASWVALSTIGLSMASDGTITGTPTNLTQNSYTIRVTANDGGPGTSGTFTLTVNRKPQLAATISNMATPMGQAWSYVIPAGTFTDPEGVGLTYSVSNLPGWMTYTPSTRTLTGTPPSLTPVTLNVTASDGVTSSVPTSFTLSITNDQPVILNPIPDVSISRNKPWSYTFPTNTFFEPNGQAMSYVAAGMPAGVTFDSASRTFSGTPSTLGTSVIYVTATDGTLQVTDSFVVTVTNSPPVYSTAMPDRLIPYGTAANWTLPTNAFTDVNSDGLSYSAIVEIPAHTKLVWWVDTWEEWPVAAQWVPLSNAGLSINASNGTITGTPGMLSADNQQFNAYRIQVTATETTGTGLSASGIFNARVNRTPTASAVGNMSIPHGVAWSCTFSGFQDPDQDALTFTANTLPAGLSLNSSTGVLSGTPTTDGATTITITATDPYGAAVSKTFTLTVTNSAPTVPNPIPDQQLQAGSAFNYTIPAFSDTNNDTLTYTPSALPSGLSFNGTTRQFSGMPVTGTHTITITATDGRGGSISDTFVLTVSAGNLAPTVDQAGLNTLSGACDTYDYGGPRTIPIASYFSDANGDTLTYSQTGAPTWLVLNSSTGVFSGSRANLEYYFVITVTASDGRGGSVNGTFTISNTPDSGGQVPLATEPQTFMLASDSSGEEQSFVSDSPDMTESAATTSSYYEDYPDPTAPPQGLGDNSFATSQDVWYAYDAENRVTVANGQLVNGEILLSTNAASAAYTYDAAGNQISRIAYIGGQQLIEQRAYDLRGHQIYTFQPVAIGAGASASTNVAQANTYDAVGRLVQQVDYYGPNSYRAKYGGGTQDISGWAKHAELYTYDLDGRVTFQNTLGRVLNWTATDNADGQTSLGVLGYLSNVTTYYDSLSRSSGYRWRYNAHDENFTGPANDPTGYTHTYTINYEGRDSYLEKSVHGYSTNSYFKASTSTSQYDAWGRRVAVREHTPNQDVDDRGRYFAYDGEGGILRRREGKMSGDNTFSQSSEQVGKDAVFAYVNGQQVAEQTRDGKKLDVFGQWSATDGDYGAPKLDKNARKRVARSRAKGNYLGAYDQATARYSFYDPTPTGRSTVVVQRGDSLQGIAQRVYGNSSLWYVLAEANAISTNADLIAGTQLQVPDVSANKNDAATFKPYRPSDVIGSTAPNLPYIPPPSGGGCGMVAMVLMVAIIIIAAVVAPYIAPYIAQGLGAVGITSTAIVTGVTAGAATAIGSAVVQGVGSALGVTSFSWKQVAVDGIKAGITAGFSKWAQGVSALTKGAEMVNGVQQLNTWGKVASAMVSYGGSVVANAAVNRDTNFSWKDVAVTAVATYASAELGLDKPMKLTSGTTQLGRTLNSSPGAFLSGALSATGRRLMGGGKQDWMGIAADAFGNAYANAAVDDINKWHAARAVDAAGGDNYMQRWREEDERQLQMEIAAEEASRLPDWSSFNQSAPLDATSRTQQLPDMYVALSADERNRLASTTIYHTRHMDPYAIARNGGNADQYDVMQTFWVPETAPPVTTEYLPEEAPRVAAGPLSANARDAFYFDQQRQGYRSFYDQYRGSLLGDMAANAGTIFANGKVSIVQGLNTSWNLMTDRQSGDEFKSSLWNTVSNPRRTYRGMVSNTADFFAMPSDEQAFIIGEGAVAFVATAGTETLVAKGAGVIDDLVPSTSRSLRVDPIFDPPVPVRLASGPTKAVMLRGESDFIFVAKQQNALQFADDLAELNAISEVGGTEGRLDIVAHGTPTSISVGGESMGAKQFADLLRRNGALDGYSCVKFYSCSLGADVAEGLNFAQEFANEVRMPTTAATRDIFSANGNLFIADDMKYSWETNSHVPVNTGEFVDFTPWD